MRNEQLGFPLTKRRMQKMLARLTPPVKRKRPSASISVVGC
jgi:hypothetical protein